MCVTTQESEAEKTCQSEGWKMRETCFRPETFSFLKSLAVNNNKDWFNDNKSAYQQSVKKPADAFRPALADGLAKLTGHEVGSKQFRINRDLRFSKDKTPYNTHIRMAFWPKGALFEGKDAQPPSFFLSIEQNHVRFGAGCMAFSKPVLGTYLLMLEQGAGDEINALYARLEADGFERSEPDLVNPPRGFPKDHADAGLARHKGLATWKTLGTTNLLLEANAAERMAEEWQPTLNFWRFLVNLHEKT
jgi:uncharacterized protein (TIGR02453 family)